jgi:hypothetical protein
MNNDYADCPDSQVGCGPDEVIVAPYGTEPPAAMASAPVTHEALAANRRRVQSIAKALNDLPPGLTDADFKAAMPPLESNFQSEYPGESVGTDFTTPEPPPEATFQAPTRSPKHTTPSRHYTLADITDTKPTTHMQLQPGPNGMEVVQVNSTSQPHHLQFQRAPDDDEDKPLDPLIQDSESAIKTYYENDPRRIHEGPRRRSTLAGC